MRPVPLVRKVPRARGAKLERPGWRDRRASQEKKAKRDRRDRRALAAKPARLVPLGRQVSWACEPSM